MSLMSSLERVVFIAKQGKAWQVSLPLQAWLIMNWLSRRDALETSVLSSTYKSLLQYSEVRDT